MITKKYSRLLVKLSLILIDRIKNIGYTQFTDVVN